MAFLIDCDKKEEFSIPRGETVIGRGPYLQVKEQILSRSHAVLSFNDGVVKIKPTHRHPTYFYSAHSLQTGIPLEKDEWKDLQDGNCISLLSNAYKYCIKIVSHHGSSEANVDGENGKFDEQQNTPFINEKLFDQPTVPCVPCTLQNDELLDETLPVETSTIKKDEDAVLKSRCDESLVVGTSQSKKVVSVVKWKFDQTTSFSEKQTTISANKKRRLPAWMCESEVVVKKTKVAPRKPASKKAPGKAKGRILHKNTERLLLQQVCYYKDQTVDGGITTPGEGDGIRSKDSPCNKALIDSPPSSPSMLGLSAHCKSVVDSPPNSPSMLDASPPHKSDIDISYNSPSVLDALPPKESDIDSPTNYPSMLDDSSVQNVVEDGETNQHTLSSQKQRCQIETSPLHEASYNISAGAPMKETTHPTETKLTTPTKEKDEKEKTTSEETVMKKEDSEGSSVEDQRNKPAKVCPYGKRCYRVNPVHFREFSHPSHDDESEDDNGDDSEDDNKQKSECPYGMDCYRQSNPHHTQEFAHNLLGKQKRRAARHTKGKKGKVKSLLDEESDNDGENEYDLNDSFIASTDESSGYSDDPNDSDYDPRGGKDDDDDEEDVDELVSEAKGFIKNKKM